jgi:hypothetical protein
MWRHTGDGRRLRLGRRGYGMVVRRTEAVGPPRVAVVAPFQPEGILLESTGGSSVKRTNNTAG